MLASYNINDKKIELHKELLLMTKNIESMSEHTKYFAERIERKSLTLFRCTECAKWIIETLYNDEKKCFTCDTTADGFPGCGHDDEILSEWSSSNSDDDSDNYYNK